ncbi:MAG TPA: hypothetical protein VMM82_12690 [Spirochaetia bacterium]|nr:hypothetical protein [Spirochaetia bacterium]
MKYVLPVLCVLALTLTSCFSLGGGTSTPVYQSHAPEVRGERAISSNIELAKEVDLEGSWLGVFYSHEVYASGDVQTILFARRDKSGPEKGSMDDFDLSGTTSMSTDQARKFVSAIDNYLAMDTKSLSPTKMYNFELYSGTLDMSAGTEKYRPFQDITFVVVCSVTNTKKIFKTVFPSTAYDGYGRRYVTYQTFELKQPQVENLRKAVAAALDKSTPTPVPAPAAPSKSGT